MAAMIIDGHVADLYVGGAVRPFAHMQDSDQILTPCQRDLILASSDEFDLIFAVNGDVLFIAAWLEKDRIALPRRIDRLLNRLEITSTVECHHECSLSDWRSFLRAHHSAPGKTPERYATKHHYSSHETFIQAHSARSQSVGRCATTFQGSHAILRCMIVVGLTGGIATGKSTVAQMFKQCGAIVIDADQLARNVVRRGSPAWREIVKHFGKSILNPDQTINRHALGDIVFHHRGKLRKLERIIHPRVAREKERLVRQVAKRTPHAVVIYEVPLLFEVGAEKRVDKTLVVTADRETQIARLKKRNGLSRAEALRRITSQIPLNKKARLADVVLNGSKPRPVLKSEVRRLARRLAGQLPV